MCTQYTLILKSCNLLVMKQNRFLKPKIIMGVNNTVYNNGNTVFSGILSDPRLLSRNIVDTCFITVRFICELCLRFTNGETKAYDLIIKFT